MTFPLTLSLALLLDALLGDPQRGLPVGPHELPHPVVGIGRLVAFLERLLYPGGGPSSGGRARARGLLLCGATLLLTGTAVGVLLAAAAWRPWLLAAVQVYLLYAALAWRSLKDETLPVALALFRRDLPGARNALSRVVGRDTAPLGTADVARAAVETVAENSVDGVLSVIFFAALGWRLGGGTGMALCVWLFKAASTLDSMVGYDNPRYHDFGRASARLDDALNFLPARFAGLIIVLAGGCLGHSPFAALRVFLRDRKKHKSPNSAHGESAFAGVLGLSLGGGAIYGGVLEARPRLGDGAVPQPADILRAHKLLDASTALSALLAIALWAF
ncbi:MAG: cobalamin biosynthesis protein CobD [Fretibacterium sp.]|nr:cobalamin biosynthesis protein CobD [Fretibacterium sp.]